MRPVRATALTAAGFFAGLVTTALLLKRALPSRGDADSDEVALAAIFDGVELESRATAFRGGSMLAWWGGISVDLRRATLAPEARLAVTALWGGVNLRVPPGWRVESSMTSLAGGVAVDAPEPEDPDAPRLVLDGRAIFGGVAVKAAQPDTLTD